MCTRTPFTNNKLPTGCTWCTLISPFSHISSLASQLLQSHTIPLFFLKRHSTCTMCTHAIYVIDFMKKEEVHIGKPNLHRVHMHVHRELAAKPECRELGAES